MGCASCGLGQRDGPVHEWFDFDHQVIGLDLRAVGVAQNCFCHAAQRAPSAGCPAQALQDGFLFEGLERAAAHEGEGSLDDDEVSGKLARGEERVGGECCECGRAPAGERFGQTPADERESGFGEASAGAGGANALALEGGDDVVASDADGVVTEDEARERILAQSILREEVQVDFRGGGEVALESLLLSAAPGVVGGCRFIMEEHEPVEVGGGRPGFAGGDTAGEIGGGDAGTEAQASVTIGGGNEGLELGLYVHGVGIPYCGSGAWGIVSGDEAFDQARDAHGPIMGAAAFLAVGRREAWAGGLDAEIP